MITQFWSVKKAQFVSFTESQILNPTQQWAQLQNGLVETEMAQSKKKVNFF